jgi:hypothetical protein
LITAVLENRLLDEPGGRETFASRRRTQLVAGGKAPEILMVKVGGLPEVVKEEQGLMPMQSLALKPAAGLTRLPERVSVTLVMLAVAVAVAELTNVILKVTISPSLRGVDLL